MYAIMLGLILVNAFMFIQGKFLTNLFAKVVSVPQEILTPIIVMFCFAGPTPSTRTTFDVLVALVFCAVAWLLRKIDFPVPILLGLVLGKMAETNFRRALMISRRQLFHLRIRACTASRFLRSPRWSSALRHSEGTR